MSKSTSRSKRVLMVVSADIEAGLAQPSAPKRDYWELARAINAETLDFGSVLRTKLGRRLARLVGRNVTMTLAALPKSLAYATTFFDGEHIGLPFAALSRLLPVRWRPRCVVLAHHLTPRKKHAIARLARPAIDTLIVHSKAQKAFAVRHLGFSPDRVVLLPYQVDLDYWQPQESAVDSRLISTAGLECRDYDTLLAAVPGIDVRVCIGAASNWSHKANTLTGRHLPRNVTVSTYDYPALRQLYQSSAFVVVPLLDVDFQAGITTILEAMAMAKAVCVTQSQGQRDVVVGPLWSANQTSWPENVALETATGIYVPPGDPQAMASAIHFLLENPDVAQRLGLNGRGRAEQLYGLDRFVQRFSEAILRGADPKPASGRAQVSPSMSR